MQNFDFTNYKDLEVLPTVADYAKLLNTAVKKFGITENEARKLYGSLNYSQWYKVLNIGYNYAIIQPNNPNLKRESVLSFNKYLKSKKYAFICKGVHKDGSESTYFIKYSNDLEAFQKDAAEYVSFYNYPIGIFKAIDGSIKKLS